jgi:hypothetical protein
VIKKSIFENMPGSNLQSTMRRKIKLARWLTKKIAEYDVTNDFWDVQTAEVEFNFNAFSTTIYLPSQDLVVVGGLDDRMPNKPTFSDKCVLVQEVPINSYQNRYVEKMLPAMHSRRGCTSAVYHEGYIYVFGGINYTDKVMKKCERLALIDLPEAGDFSQSKWQKIADMKECRKNASACSVTTDTIYVFGGSSNSQQALDTIEQYSLVSNRWSTIAVAMPRALCFLTTFKLSPTKILILGGSQKEQPASAAGKGRSHVSKEVHLFDLLKPDFEPLKPLSQGFISLYPAFFDGSKQSVFLVNENCNAKVPQVLQYKLEVI